MGWQAVQYVTSGLTLVALVVAATFYYFAARLRNRVEVIKSTPEKDRLEAIYASAAEYHIEVNNLSEREKGKFIRDWLKIRGRREIMIAVVATIIAAMLSVIAIVAMLQHEEPLPSPAPAPKKTVWLTQEVRAEAKISAGVSGSRENCSGGNAEDCVRPKKPGGRLVVGSGTMSQLQSALAIGNGTTVTVTVNTPAQICIRITATTGDCRIWNTASGFVTATEEFPVEQ